MLNIDDFKRLAEYKSEYDRNMCIVLDNTLDNATLKIANDNVAYYAYHIRKLATTELAELLLKNPMPWDYDDNGIPYYLPE